MDKRFLIALSAMVFVFAGCESAGPKTQKGALAGGLLGAAAGGIIGYQTGHPLAGAGIGAAAGAVGGALLGNAWDKQDQKAVADNPGYLPLTKIAEMGDQGTPDAIIINEIQRTKSVYHLNSEMITYLKQHKITDPVINYIMDTGASK